MGTTFVTLSHEPSGKEPGFWMRDGMLELWLRLLALHLPEPTDSGEHRSTLAIRNQWLLASRGYFGGCVPHGMEEACATPEGRAVVRAAIDSLLSALQQGSAPLDVATLDLLGIEGFQFAPIERVWLREIGQAFIDLLDGKITCTASSTEVMPGSKPYTTAVPGSAGDVDYDTHGQGYAGLRRTDPRIAAQVHSALGEARTVLNVGAGAGSYEPQDRYVLALEPSATMRAERPRHLAPAIQGIAEKLPLDDQSVDASMALVTVHQWRDLDLGLRELRRVTRGPIVVLTFDRDALDRYWLADYAPELMAVERRRYPSLETIARGLGGFTEVQVVPIPIDCVDGFTEAHYARPEAFLDAAVRSAQSAWSFVRAEDQSRIVTTLADDLQSGEWDRKYGAWRSMPCFEGSLRLIVSHAAGRSRYE